MFLLPKTLINIKEDILLVTKKLLTEEGYEKLNIRNIASKCGIATGTLYNYYKSKQEIVEEIIKTEWNAMLRRVEQVTKTDMEVIGKLEVIYNELGSIMNDVHKLWFDISNSKIDGELSKIKCHKKIWLKGLSDKILYIIGNEAENKDYEFLSDVICNMLILYAHQGDVEFKKLSPVIESLLRQ